jgi:hypothetical protein
MAVGLRAWIMGFGFVEVVGAIVGVVARITHVLPPPPCSMHLQTQLLSGLAAHTRLVAYMGWGLSLPLLSTPPPPLPSPPSQG